MADVRVDEEGRVPLPPDVRAALGWKPGQEVHLQVEGDQLLVQAATPATSLKDEARRLAQAMEGLTREAARQVADTVSSLNEKVATGQAAPRVGGFQGVSPRVAPGVYLAPGSTVMGDVSLGEEASVWPGVVLRGDVAPVRVGARTN